MKVTAKIMVGIPGSGKTTWSKALVVDDPTYMRVNRDDLREMLNGGKYTTGNENFVRVVRDELIEVAFTLGRNVVVDDTNCYGDKLEALIYDIRLSARRAKVEVMVELVVFDTALETCIERRRGIIEESVVRHMKNEKDKIDFDRLVVDAVTYVTS